MPVTYPLYSTNYPMIIIAIMSPERTYCCALVINNLSAYMYTHMYSMHMYMWLAPSAKHWQCTVCVYIYVQYRCTLNVIYTGQMMRNQCKSHTCMHSHLRTQTFVDKHTHTHTQLTSFLIETSKHTTHHQVCNQACNILVRPPPTNKLS